MADHQQADRAALALDNGVCRQGGRQGDQADVPAIVAEHAFHRAAHADGQVVLGGQRLGGADDTLVGVEEDGVRIGAAGVDTQKRWQIGVS